MRLFEIIVSVLVGGFAVAFALSLFVEEPALSLQVLVVLVLLLLAFVVIKYWNSNGTTIKYKRVQTPLKSEKPLDKGDLDKILTLLKKHQYSGKSYYRLGLSLGLLDSTLDIIKADNNNGIEHCLREVLTKWLEKADNVEKPTWSALIAALRSVNQNAVAEGIDRETDPVSMIIENHRRALSQSIQENLIDIARLLSYELEDKSLELLHGSPSEKIEVLLKTVKNAVYENYKNILKFADVLCKFSAVRSVGNDIQKNYSEIIVDNSIEVRAMGRNDDPIKVPLNFSLECKEMRNKWAIAVDSAIKVIAVRVEEQELKGFLQIQTSNSDVKEKLNTCHSTGEIMQIIIDHCSLVDLTLLEGIIERFKIEEAKEHINEYKKSLNDFCSISLRSLLNETIGCPSSLKCETLELSVNKSIDERTLKDVQDVIAIAFESFATNVRVVVIKEGNSFIITCSFPLALSESLIATALKNLEQLKKEGLIKLTIGYSTVYPQNKVKVVAVEKFRKFISKIPSPLTWSIYSETEKRQHITSVYNSSGTMKQLLVSLNVQSIKLNEVSFNEEGMMTALIKESENKELKKTVKTLQRISKMKDQEIEDFKVVAIKEKLKTENDLKLQIEELTIAITKKESQIKDLNTIIIEKDATIAEFQHLMGIMADLELEDKNDIVDTSSESEYEMEEVLKEYTEIISPSLQTCWEEIAELKNNKNDEYILRHLSPQAVRLLITALLNAKTVMQLKIYSSPLTSDFILSLSSQLSSNESIWSLEFKDSTLDDDGVTALARLLQGNTRVTHLSVSYNINITSVSVQPLKELLLTNKTLKKLHILDTSIDTDGVLSLLETLEMNKQIHITLNKQHEKACSSLPYYDAIKESLLFL